MPTNKTPARQIHTSIRVPVTAEEYAAIKRAAKLRGSPSLAAWLRERGSCFGLADGMEALAVREEAMDALRALLEKYAAMEEADAMVDARPRPTGALIAYHDAWDAFHLALEKAREVAK